MDSSSGSDSADFDRVLLTPKRRLGSKKWQEVEISEDDLKRDWRKNKAYRFQNSEVLEFYCANGRYCIAKVKQRTLVNGAVIYLSNGKDHSNHRSSNHGLTEEQKRVVAECFAAGVTAPNSILVTFKSKKMEEPPKAKLTNYLQRHRKNLVTTKIESDVGDVISWAKEHSEIPDDIDKPYVIDHDVGDTSSSGCHIRIFVSTVRLLKLANFFQHVHTDATYKLNHQGYPLLVAGVTDLGKSFHPCGIAICKSECADDYEFMFRSLKKGVESVTNVNYNPAYVIADCADAITNGARAAFGQDFKRVYCYVHMIRSCDRHLPGVKNRLQREMIRKDITLLRLATSPAIFLAAANLFVTKWKEAEPRFTSYFENQWIRDKPDWYLGFVPYGIPTHNNALESTNRYIKDQFTKRKRRVIGEFLATSFTILGTWSANRNGEGPNCISLQYRLTLEMPVLKKADAWIKTAPNITYLQHGRDTVAYIRANGKRVKLSDAKQLSMDTRVVKWKTFDDFVLSEIYVHKVTFSESAYLLDYKCTRSSFLKHYICMHTIGIAQKQNKFDLPPEAATGGLGTRKGPGRPKKCAKAFVKE